MDSRETVALIVDAGSWESWDTPPEHRRAAEDPDYASALESAEAASGADESVITGSATVMGHRVAIIASDFDFLAGSIGADAAGRVVRAAERAARERVPLLGLPRSGGTRMQEGTDAFVLMVSIVAAVMEHRRAGLPFITYLRHPTTGGVTASWGSLGHLTWAEPEALVGFLGPRVYQALHGEAFPRGIQLGENLAERGVIDEVIPREEIRHRIGDLLSILAPAAPAAAAAIDDPVEFDAGLEAGLDSGLTAWDAICTTRDPGRPGIRALLDEISDGFAELHGTATGERDDAILTAVARIGGQPCVVVGHDRSAAPRGPMGPGALRGAQRAFRIAAELRLPILTVVDTEGAELSAEAENAALASEIARTIAALVSHPSPVISVLLGSGCGGGALALMPADRILAAERAWVTPLPPEGAAVIMHRDASRAAEVASQQRVRAIDLLAGGLVDSVVPEPAGSNVPADVASAVRSALAELVAEDDTERIAARSARFRSAVS